MKRMLTIFGLALLMCSCAPNFYYLPLQKMTKSESGHNLVGTSIAIVFADPSFFMCNISVQSRLITPSPRSNRWLNLQR